MIWQSLRDKLATRGPLGIARDAAELAFACTVIGVYELALAGGVLAGLVVALPVAAIVRLTRPFRAAPVCGCVNSFDECRCGAGRAS